MRNEYRTKVSLQWNFHQVPSNQAKVSLSYQSNENGAKRYPPPLQNLLQNSTQWRRKVCKKHSIASIDKSTNSVNEAHMQYPIHSYKKNINKKQIDLPKRMRHQNQWFRMHLSQFDQRRLQLVNHEQVIEPTDVNMRLYQIQFQAQIQQFQSFSE